MDSEFLELAPGLGCCVESALVSWRDWGHALGFSLDFIREAANS